jgi:hypothetical protein
MIVNNIYFLGILILLYIIIFNIKTSYRYEVVILEEDDLTEEEVIIYIIGSGKMNKGICI